MTETERRTLERQVVALAKRVFAGRSDDEIEAALAPFGTAFEPMFAGRLTSARVLAAARRDPEAMAFLLAATAIFDPESTLPLADGMRVAAEADLELRRGATRALRLCLREGPTNLSRLQEKLVASGSFAAGLTRDPSVLAELRRLATEAPPALLEERVSAWVTLARSSVLPDRIVAAKALGRMQGEAALRTLAQEVDDASVELARAAALAEVRVDPMTALARTEAWFGPDEARSPAGVQRLRRLVEAFEESEAFASRGWLRADAEPWIDRLAGCLDAAGGESFMPWLESLAASAALDRVLARRLRQVLAGRRPAPSPGVRPFAGAPPRRTLPRRSPLNVEAMWTEGRATFAGLGALELPPAVRPGHVVYAKVRAREPRRGLTVVELFTHDRAVGAAVADASGWGIWQRTANAALAPCLAFRPARPRELPQFVGGAAALVQCESTGYDLDARAHVYRLELRSWEEVEQRATGSSVTFTLPRTGVEHLELSPDETHVAGWLTSGEGAGGYFVAALTGDAPRILVSDFSFGRTLPPRWNARGTRVLCCAEPGRHPGHGIVSIYDVVAGVSGRHEVVPASAVAHPRELLDAVLVDGRSGECLRLWMKKKEGFELAAPLPPVIVL